MNSPSSFLKPGICNRREKRGERGGGFSDEKSESVALPTVELFSEEKVPHRSANSASYCKFRVKELKIGVIGMARSGIAAANLAFDSGADVLVSDIRPKKYLRGALKQLRDGISTECGLHSQQLLNSDIVIKSPGVPNNIDILQKLRKKKIPVWSEIEFAARLINPKRIIAITGTNGKTTTTTLTGELFKNDGQKNVVAGNIGEPLSAEAAKVDSLTSVIIEVSSYQLEDSHKFHPQISAVLNVTPDHLEHHYSMKNYALAKARIFRNQTKKDYCVINYDDPICRRLSKLCPAAVIFFSRKSALKSGVFYRDNTMHVRLPFANFSICAKLKIPGAHNIENALAAAAIAVISGVKHGIIKKTLSSFNGVEHRIEFAAEINGVRYINDSKSTNVDSTLVALKSFGSPVWLILGGRDKGAPYAPLLPSIKKNVKGILLIGEAASKIRKELMPAAEFYEAGTLKNAIKIAAGLAKPGEIVLLSPACASFDQFKDYEDRGRQFKALVKKIR